MRSQVLYNLGLCLWQLSFDEAAMKQLLDAPVVEPLVALLKEGVHCAPCCACALPAPAACRCHLMPGERERHPDSTHAGEARCAACSAVAAGMGFGEMLGRAPLLSPL